MKWICCSYSRLVSITMLAGSFVIASGAPLMAYSPPQSDQTTPSDRPAIAPLPEAPQPQSAQTAQESTQAPTGAAGAKTSPAKGAPAAQPVGAAVAPARQHGHRSLLIKAGLLVGAGVAVGTVVALSARSPSRPPGTSSSTRP
jgi:hypothetical protein